MMNIFRKIKENIHAFFFFGMLALLTIMFVVMAFFVPWLAIGAIAFSLPAMDWSSEENSDCDKEDKEDDDISPAAVASMSSAAASTMILAALI